MKHRILLGAAIAAFAIPAAGASAQSLPDIIGAIAQSQLGVRNGQTNPYGPYGQSTQSLPGIIGAIAQSQLGVRYGQTDPYDPYGQYGYGQSGYRQNGQYGAYGYGRVSQSQAIRIAQSEGIQVQSATRLGGSYAITGRDDNGQRVTLRIDGRTGQIVDVNRQWDRGDDGRWDRADRHREHDRRHHGRSHDDDDNDEDDDD